MDRGKAVSGEDKPLTEWVRARSLSDRGSYRAGVFWPRVWTYRQLSGQALASVLGCNLLEASVVDASEVPSAALTGELAEPAPQNEMVRREGPAPKGEDTPAEDTETGEGPQLLFSAHAPQAEPDARPARKERRNKR